MYFAENGHVDFDEFCHLMKKYHRQSLVFRKDKTAEEEEMRNAFKVCY